MGCATASERASERLSVKTLMSRIPERVPRKMRRDAHARTPIASRVQVSVKNRAVLERLQDGSASRRRNTHRTLDLERSVFGVSALDEESGR